MRARMSTLALVMAVAGCPDLDVDFPWCESPPVPPASEGLAPTWWRDVRPVVLTRCGGCHVEGGLAPFPLTTALEAQRFADDIRRVVLDGTMPPWPPEPCCNRYRFSRALSAEETALLVAWVDRGAPEGDLADATEVKPPLGGLSRVDLVVDMPVEHVPAPRGDSTHEYRCFIADWPKEQPTHVTGADVLPGVRALVHHVIVFVVGPTEVKALEDEDARDDAPGFPCEGGIPRTPVQGSIAGWVPGSAAHDFPDGIGLPVEPGSRLVFGMHYKLDGAEPRADRSRVVLKLDDDVAEPALWLSLANPVWYTLSDGMLIPAGDDDVTHLYHGDLTAVYAPLQTLRVHNVDLHMHDLGSRGLLGVLRADGRRECLLQIDAWSADWQGEYWLEEPVDVHPGDQLYVECHWDNSAGNQRNGQTPRDLRWAEDEEMCAGYFLATRH